MKFKTIVRVKSTATYTEFNCDGKETYEEAVAAGEIAKAIWGDDFIDYRVEEV